MNNKGVTGLQLTIWPAVYLILLTIFFMYWPGTGGYAVLGVNLNTTTPTYNESASSSSVLGTVSDMLTFNIIGLPIWANLIFVYLPFLILGLGIYGILRGI